MIIDIFKFLRYFFAQFCSFLSYCVQCKLQSNAFLITCCALFIINIVINSKLCFMLFSHIKHCFCQVYRCKFTMQLQRKVICRHSMCFHLQRDSLALPRSESCQEILATTMEIFPHRVPMFMELMQAGTLSLSLSVSLSWTNLRWCCYCW